MLRKNPEVNIEYKSRTVEENEPITWNIALKYMEKYLKRRHLTKGILELLSDRFCIRSSPGIIPKNKKIFKCDLIKAYYVLKNEERCLIVVEEMFYIAMIRFINDEEFQKTVKLIEKFQQNNSILREENQTEFINIGERIYSMSYPSEISVSSDRSDSVNKETSVGTKEELFDKLSILLNDEENNENIEDSYCTINNECEGYVPFKEENIIEDLIQSSCSIKEVEEFFQEAEPYFQNNMNQDIQDKLNETYQNTDNILQFKFANDLLYIEDQDLEKSIESEIYGGSIYMYSQQYSLTSNYVFAQCDTET